MRSRRSSGAAFRSESKFQGHLAKAPRAICAAEAVTLHEPVGRSRLRGGALSSPIPPAEISVVHDELDLLPARRR
jgi:hypothetical protein